MKQPLNWRPSAQILSLLGITFFSVILFSFFGIILALSFGINLDITQLENVTDASVFPLKIMQMVQSIAIFFVPPILMGTFFSTSLKKYLGLRRPVTKEILLAGLTALFAISFINGVGFINQCIDLSSWLGDVWTWMVDKEKETNHLIELMLTTDSISGLLLNVLVIAIVPAIGEELFFRGVLQQQLYKMLKNPHIAIWLTAFIFSAIHFQFLTFFARFFMGVILGYLYYWSGNLWVSIMAHFINNFAATIAFYVSGSDSSEASLNDIDFGFIMSFTVSVLITFSLLQFIYKSTKQRKASIETEQNTSLNN